MSGQSEQTGADDADSEPAEVAPSESALESADTGMTPVGTEPESASGPEADAPMLAEVIPLRHPVPAPSGPSLSIGPDPDKPLVLDEEFDDEIAEIFLEEAGRGSGND